MNENRHKILKSSFGVALATLFSRILGLGRVMLEARVLGGGTLASAWVLAFMVPNLFRRILGEGALGSALIPLLTGIEEKEGDREVRYNLTVVFAALSAILLVIVLVTSLAAIAADVWISPHISAEYEHVKLAIKVLPVLMPYAFFICIIGIAGSILNSKRVFFLPALGALLLNIMLILAMLILRHIGNQSPMHTLNSLGWTVIAAGVVHLLLLIVLLKRNNRLPLFKLQAVKNSRMLRNLWHLTLPGIIGASATQVSFIIDRALAAFIGPEAAPALNYTERVVYLPIGVFALALGSVLLTDMARAAARDGTAGRERISGRDRAFGDHGAASGIYPESGDGDAGNGDRRESVYRNPGNSGAGCGGSRDEYVELSTAENCALPVSGFRLSGQSDYLRA